MSRWIDEHYYKIRGPAQEQRVQLGDWIKVTWMEGEPTAEVIGLDEHGWPVIEHPATPGIGPMTCDVYDIVARHDDPVLFVGVGL